MKKLNGWKRTVAVLALAGASIGVWEGGSALIQNVQFARAEQQVETSREQLQKVEDLATVFRNVGKAIEPTVVQIEVTKTIHGVHRRMMPGNDDFLRRFFRDRGLQQPPDFNDQNDNGDDNNNGSDAPDDSDLQQSGTGSGVIMEVDGSDAYILTNNHVAGGATKMTIKLNDGRLITNGKTLGADAKADLAVVKISADHLIAAKWGDSDQLDRGDWVLAFGSPFGYVGSMTHGIVSALHRTDVGILGNEGYENFIQVDAPINPGNSGGPLVNIHGDVIGINTAIATQSGGFQGIGFAIPANQAKGIYAQLKEHGKVTRGWLGVEIADVHNEPELAKQSGYDKDTGVIVHQVLQGTPAYGKLQPGDVITGIDGKVVDNVQQLRNQIALLAPGSKTKFTVYRDNKPVDVEVKIGEQPENMAMASRGAGSAPGANESVIETLGIHLSNVTDELADKYGLADARKGALVTSIDPRSVAATPRAGLQVGDLITKIGDQPVNNVKDAEDILAKQDLSKGIRIFVTNRQGTGMHFLQNTK